MALYLNCDHTWLQGTLSRNHTWLQGALTTNHLRVYYSFRL